MALPIYITADKVKAVLTYESLLKAVERGLSLYSKSQDSAKGGECTSVVDQPVRTVVNVPSKTGFLACMPAYVEADGILATKVVTIFPKNRDVPTHNAVIIVNCVNTGVPRAILDGDVITTMRTAAASVVATKYLVNGDPQVLAILGSGTQADSHYDAMATVFKFSQVRVWNHRPEGSQAFAISENHRHNTVACKTPEEAVQDADVIVVVTSARTPVLMAQGIKPGAHINAVGACHPSMAEIDPELMRSSVVYVDSVEGALKESGDIIQSKAKVFAEIGEVINGTKEAQREKTTIFKSLGMAIEDAVAAKVVLDHLGSNEEPA